MLFDELAEHYGESQEDFVMEDDLKLQDEHALAKIFSKMSDYYFNGIGKANNPDHQDLWLVYM